MKRIDDQENETWVNVLVYGRTGTGKTSLGVTAPSPLILLSERQGMLHVRQAAKRLGVPIPPTLAIESTADLRAVLGAFRQHKPGAPWRVMVDGAVALELPAPPSTLVVDSLTDVARMVVDEIRRQSPPQPGKDGLPVDSQRFWNVLQDRMQGLVLAFRDAPCHTLFLALADDRSEGEGDAKTRSVTPALPMRKLPDMVAAATNAVGYSYRTEHREGEEVRVAFAVMFSGPEHLMLKPCAPLRARERAHFGQWVEAIQKGAGIGGAAPPPSAEGLQEVAHAVEAAPVEKPAKGKKGVAS